MVFDFKGTPLNLNNIEVVCEYVTGYKLHKMLKESGFERRPQMIYNYISKGLIKSEVVEGQRLVRLDIAKLWIEKFVKKNTKVLVEV